MRILRTPTSVHRARRRRGRVSTRSGLVRPRPARRRRRRPRRCDRRARPAARWPSCTGVTAATSLALARRVLGDRVLAEEVVQEVFVRTWNAARALRRRTRFDAVVPLRAGARPRRRPAPRRERAPSARAARCTAQSPRFDDDLEREVLELAEAEAVRRRAHDAVRTASAPPSSSRTSAATPTKRSRCLLEQPEGTVKSRIRSGLLRLRAALIDAGVHQ